jgi:hypothetical protein
MGYDNARTAAAAPSGSAPGTASRTLDHPARLCPRGETHHATSPPNPGTQIEIA